MQEDVLHYIWQYKKFDSSQLETTQHERVSLLHVGEHNFNSGPDFFNAQLKIDAQLWAGNVEIHVKSSDWFVHHHEQDPAYDNVILHVVWEHDTDVFRKNNTVIPTLELKDVVDSQLINNYKTLMNSHEKWINCETDFKDIDEFVFNNWMERLYFERLERKSNTINTLLQESQNNWEAVLFKMLAKNFGLKVNGDAFYSLAQSVDFSIIRKSQSKIIQLEALFFGQSGLLDADEESGYFKNLSDEYQFLKQKFQLSNTHVLPFQFFRLRPPNFPTIRLSQLANLYHEHTNLFSKIIETNTLNDFYELFKVDTSPFWKTHYTFGKTSKPLLKTLTKSFIDLLLINTVLPIKFCYSKQNGHAIDELLLGIVKQITPEKNSIIKSFNELKPVSKTAMDSQALLQLKTEYCDKNKCLHCAIGNALIIK
ncbi:DUF2851 family protein [Lacinutrix undariae]